MLVKPILGKRIAIQELNSFHLVNLIDCLRDLEPALSPARAKERAQGIVGKASQDQSRIPRNHFEFIISRLGSGECLGGCSLRLNRTVLCEADIGYYTHSSVRRQGIAREAALLLERLAFEQLGAFRVTARVQRSNIASIRVLHSLGYAVSDSVLDELIFAKVKPVSFFSENQAKAQPAYGNFATLRP